MEPELVEGFEPGHYLHALELETDAGKMAYPITQYASTDQKELLSYYGISMK
jgi:hypothetical protein